jgi:hypothetical protein
VLIHGNYEFELYPQPAHRQLALELIDAGVHSVIFHHPHRVGPVERYKRRSLTARFLEGSCDAQNPVFSRLQSSSVDMSLYGIAWFTIIML